MILAAKVVSLIQISKLINSKLYNNVFFSFFFFEEARKKTIFAVRNSK